MRLREFHLSKLDEGFRDPGIFKAIFLAGPPGAGKNLIINTLGLKSTGLKLLDIDHSLAYLNRARADKLHHNEPGYAHSLNATKRQQAVLQKEMLGLLINTTGRDYESLMDLKGQLESSGYDTFMLFVDVDKDVAWSRTQDRLTYATDPKDRRPVDKKYFNTAYDAAKGNIDFYATMFGNQFAVVDNTDHHSNLGAREGVKQLGVLLRIAAKKIQSFLNKPLTQQAQSVVNIAKQTQGVR